jgi:hypothetical protein
VSHSLFIRGVFVADKLELGSYANRIQGPRMAEMACYDRYRRIHRICDREVGWWDNREGEEDHVRLGANGQRGGCEDLVLYIIWAFTGGACSCLVGADRGLKVTVANTLLGDPV